jgi:hypothetical protein
MELNTLINYSNSLVAPSLAIFGAFIAYQQWNTNERKRKQDLFELRQKHLYSKLLQLIKTVPSIAEDILNKENYNKFDILTNYSKSRLEYGFLLSKKDSENITKLHAQIFIIVSKFVTEGPEQLKENIDKYHSEIMQKFEDDLYDIFEKYMRIENSTCIQELFPSIFIFKDKIYKILSRKIF